MQEVYDFLKKCGTYYLATTQGEQPRVRPFGTVDIYEGKFYICSEKGKNVSKQMLVNPKVEICGCSGDEWIRVEAIAIGEDDIKAEAHMLEAHPKLKPMFAPGDGKMDLFQITKATATFSSFTTEPRVVKF